jgi:ferredoxin
MQTSQRTCPHCHALCAGLGADAACPRCGQSLGAVASAPAQWYYTRDRKPHGPVSAARLKELAATGELSPADLVLRDGTQKWVAASKVKGLTFAEVPAVPRLTAALCRSALPEDFSSRQEALSEALVVPESSRCVQCGICSYNCPMGIDVREHAWSGQAIHDSHCLTCSQCVHRCPRGVLRFERIPLFTLR